MTYPEQQGFAGAPATSGPPPQSGYGSVPERPATSDPSQYALPPEDASPARTDGYISRADLEEILAERDRNHKAELAAARSAMPQAMVAAHAGGPGSDQHQVSWNLAEQEAAQRGEMLDHWVTTD
jgi:hypothetical protein